jgi:hypothetical protein
MQGTDGRELNSGESSPAFPGLESGLVFWPLMKRLDESGLESGLIGNWEKTHNKKNQIAIAEKNKEWKRNT